MWYLGTKSLNALNLRDNLYQVDTMMYHYWPHR